MRPRLLFSPLTGQVYVVTRYTMKKEGYLVAHTKYDVSEDFKIAMDASLAALSPSPARPTEEHCEGCHGCSECKP